MDLNTKQHHVTVIGVVMLKVAQSVITSAFLLVFV